MAQIDIKIVSAERQRAFRRERITALIEDMFGALIYGSCVIGFFTLIISVILACFGIISW